MAATTAVFVFANVVHRGSSARLNSGSPPFWVSPGLIGGSLNASQIKRGIRLRKSSTWMTQEMPSTTLCIRLGR